MSIGFLFPDATVELLDGFTDLPIVGAKVTAAFISTIPGGGQDVRTVTTDSSGQAFFKDLQRLPYDISTAASGYKPFVAAEWLDMRAVADHAFFRIELTPMITPQGPWFTTILVTSTFGDKPPIEGVTVTDDRGFLSGITDIEGKIVKEHDLPQFGAHELTFMKEGLVPDKITVILRDKSETFRHALTIHVARDPKRQEIKDVFDAKPPQEKAAIAILVALSIIYGMKAIAGFSAERFKPI
jgi:hypothetical protein